MFLPDLMLQNRCFYLIRLYKSLTDIYFAGYLAALRKRRTFNLIFEFLFWDLSFPASLPNFGVSDSLVSQPGLSHQTFRVNDAHLLEQIHYRDDDIIQECLERFPGYQRKLR